MSPKFSPFFSFLSAIAVIILVTLFGPEEKSLGANVRLVYLHGAWVIAAEVTMLAAAIAGGLGLLGQVVPSIRKDWLHAWSAALGRTGILFWVSYLPLSMLAMQANWNGLFLAEPRFRLALTFAVVGLLLQAGLWIIGQPWLTSAANIIFLVTLRVAFAGAEDVMHPPPSPIFNSGLWHIILYFVLLNLLAWLAAYFLSRSFLSLPENNPGITGESHEKNINPF